MTTTEIMSAGHAQDWHDNGVDGTREEVRLMTRSVVALWEIIEGREDAPTAGEFAAHATAHGGAWLLRYATGRFERVLVADGVLHADEFGWSASAFVAANDGLRWWPLAGGRPCPWPVVL